MGSSGTGTSPQMTGELFRRRSASARARALQRRAGGDERRCSRQIDSLFAITSTALPHIESGKLPALAVTSRARTALLPQVPTVPSPAARLRGGYLVRLHRPHRPPREIVDR